MAKIDLTGLLKSLSELDYVELDQAESMDWNDFFTEKKTPTAGDVINHLNDMGVLKKKVGIGHLERFKSTSLVRNDISREGDKTGQTKSPNPEPRGKITSQECSCSKQLIKIAQQQLSVLQEIRAFQETIALSMTDMNRNMEKILSQHQATSQQVMRGMLSIPNPGPVNSVIPSVSGSTTPSSGAETKIPKSHFMGI